MKNLYEVSTKGNRCFRNYMFSYASSKQEAMREYRKVFRSVPVNKVCVVLMDDIFKSRNTNRIKALSLRFSVLSHSISAVHAMSKKDMEE